MKTSSHTNNLSTEELSLWICETPEHKATDMEKYLVGLLIECGDTDKEIKNLEEQIAELEAQELDYIVDIDNLRDELEEANATIKVSEEGAIEAEQQLEKINVIFPEDMVEFCKEVAELQPRLKQLKRALVERSREQIKAQNERNRVEKENMDLKLQIKMYDSAGLEKDDDPF